MPRKDRTTDIPIEPGAQIVYDRSSSHPIEYAITLRVLHGRSWHTIYLVDNAHGFEEHHAHAYIGDRKQPPVVFEGETNTVMNDAIENLKVHWRSIYEAWERTR